MIKELMHDPIFLAGKSEVATKEDLQVAQDLLVICVAEDVKTMRNFVNHIYRTVHGILSINANSVLDVVKGSIIPE